MPIDNLQILMMNQSFLGYIHFHKFLSPTNDVKDAMIKVEYSLNYGGGFFIQRHEKLSRSPNGWNATVKNKFYKVDEFEALWKNLKANHQDIDFIVYEVDDEELDLFPHYRDGCWRWKLND